MLGHLLLIGAQGIDGAKRRVRIVLEQNRFFDGRTFDPDDLPGYLAGLPG